MNKIFSREMARGIVLLLIVSGGCALSPQLVSIDPQVDLGAASARGNGRTLALEVVDARPDPIAGRRGGIYQTDVIRTADDTIDNIYRALRDAYQSLGFRILAPGMPADIAMRVELTDLVYETQGGRVVRGVRTRAATRVISTLRNNTVTGVYQEGEGKDVFVPPSGSSNAQRLNDDMSKLLSRMIADRRLTEE